MQTYALLFSADSYEREELAKMTDKERFNLANIAANFGYKEADILSLDELSEKVNDDAIDMTNSWLYFVNI
jgi:hypothetical protein